MRPRHALPLALLGVALAGCVATPVEYCSAREIPPGPGMFSGPEGAFVFRSGASAPSSEHEEFIRWKRSRDAEEQREFDQWREWRAEKVRGEADARIEGVVRDTVVTHCDASRQGGCAGTLTLERRSAAGIETLTIRIPLGTPISHESETLLLHSLEGRTVIVTQTGQRSARAVQVIEPPFRRALAEPGGLLPSLC